MQKPGFVCATPSYDVAPLNAYSGFPWTISSNHTLAATVPSVQWPAVNTSVGESKDALHRCEGTC
jgi:hypothetical protein